MSLTCFFITFVKAGLEIINLLKLIAKDINFTIPIIKTTNFKKLFKWSNDRRKTEMATF